MVSPIEALPSGSPAGFTGGSGTAPRSKEAVVDDANGDEGDVSLFREPPDSFSSFLSFPKFKSQLIQSKKQESWAKMASAAETALFLLSPPPVQTV